MKAIETHHQGIYCKDIDESIRWYCDVFNFRHLFSTETMEGDKPLKMAWIKNDGGIIIELLETADKSCVEANAHALNHLAVRVENMDEFVALLNEKGVAIEAGPFDALCPFDRPLGAQDNDLFISITSEIRDINARCVEYVESYYPVDRNEFTISTLSH